MDRTVSFQLLHPPEQFGRLWGQERALNLEPGRQPSGFVPWACRALCPHPQNLCGGGPSLGVLGGQRAGEWGDFRTLSWEVSGDVRSRAGFSCFRILPRAGQEAGTPLQKFCLVVRNSDDPGGGGALPPLRVQRRAVLLLHLLEHLLMLAGWLVGGGHRRLPAAHREDAVFCVLTPEWLSQAEGPEMSPQRCLLRKVALVPRMDLENLLLGSF